jgi:hypothetical protein
MDLKKYFDDNSGVGIFSSSDGKTGQPNAAVYAKPHVMENGQVSFIMRDRLSHSNIRSNPRAHYLFVESGTKSEGLRLHLTMIEESSDEALIEKHARRGKRYGDDETRFLVTFEVIKALQLVGDEEIPLQ